MTDTGRFRTLAAFSLLLAIFALAYNIYGELLAPDIQGYVQRRLYYEQVISRKLDLHKGMHWREKD